MPVEAMSARRELKPDVPGTEILRGMVGSTVHGTAIDGQDDLDLMGVAIERPEYVIGLQRWEHTIARTQPEGVRSGPHDTDLTIYSLRKYVRLAMAGNPSILLLLFVPEDRLYVRTELGDALRDLASAIVSQKAGPKFLGYLTAQKERMLGMRGGRHTNRPELVGKYGYDTKYAMHMLRLGYQGRELLRTGRITLPMPAEELAICRAVRHGEWPVGKVLGWAEGLEADLRKLIDGRSRLRPKPREAYVDHWLTVAYRRQWGWSEARS